MSIEVARKESIEALKKENQQLRSQNIALLGDGEIFIRRDAGGIMRACKMQVSLSERNKEIHKIGEHWMITSAGADRLNQLPGLNIMTPQSVVVDGKEVSNPFIERHPKTRAIQAVYVRKIIFGPNPIGNMVGVDYTLFFNVYTYFLQDLQSKVRRYPVCGSYGMKDQPPTPAAPEGANRSNRPRSLVFFEIEDPVGLWVDLSHGEIQEVFNQHVSRQKFGDRHAQSICTRNALLKHPAIAAKTVEVHNGIAKIIVYGFKHDFDFKKFSEIGEKIGKGQADPKEIEVERAEEEAKFEEVSLEGSLEGDEYGSFPEESEQLGFPEGPGKEK
ncbi:MAG TPA: hypothetical protein VFA47_04095 [Candidatus Manganitrophaceae bacterium]|nr:hypothetical protein [Candidatus Manganitrophaceae bacterium]